MKPITGPQVTAMICDYVRRTGGVESVARKLDVTPDYIRKMMAGKRPGKKLYAAIGVVENDKTWRIVR